MNFRGAFERNRGQRRGEARARLRGHNELGLGGRTELHRQTGLDLGRRTADNEGAGIGRGYEMESTTEHRRGESRRRSRCSGVARSLAAVAALAMLTAASPAAAEEYDETYSGHPLRIVAYVLHPIGVILDTLIFRPFHWIGSHEPFKTLSGQQD